MGTAPYALLSSVVISDSAIKSATYSGLPQKVAD